MNRSLRLVATLALTLGMAATFSACKSSTSPTGALNSYETALVAHWRWSATDGTITETIDYTLKTDRTFTDAVTVSGGSPVDGTQSGAGTWTANSTKIFTNTTSVTGSGSFITSGPDSVAYTLSGNTLTVMPDDTTTWVMTRQ